LGENWEYADGYIFKNDTYYQTISPEGRLVWEATNWNYEFNYTDNQENLRVAFSNRNGNLEESQKATPDPWGLDIRPLSFGGADKNNYQFLNREAWDDIGWINLNKRFYMPDIGRFGQVDPVTEEQEQYSLYHYSRNNPVRFSDPEGDFCIPCAIYVFAMIVTTAQVAMAPSGGVNAKKEQAAGKAAYNSEGSSIIASVVPGGRQMKASTVIYAAAKSEVKQVIKEQASKAAEKTFQTYTKQPKDSKKDGVYSGKTSGTGTPDQNVAKRDKIHHKNETHEPAKLDKSSSKSDAIRGREQQNIDNNGGAQKQGGTSGNTNRGVSEKNPKAKQYDSAANKEFN
jgi:RHS repeat-associated protein